MVQEGIDVKHYYCLDVAGWKRQEICLKRACRLSVRGFFGFFKVKVSRGITQCPQRDSNLCPSVYLMVKAVALLREPRDGKRVGGRHEDQGPGNPQQHGASDIQVKNVRW